MEEAPKHQHKIQWGSNPQGSNCIYGGYGYNEYRSRRSDDDNILCMTSWVRENQPTPIRLLLPYIVRL